MREQFVGEALEPIGDTVRTAPMAQGLPGLPRRFRWQGQEFAVVEVLGAWKETGPDRWGGEAQYLRKHWFRVRTDSGLEMRIYFERQARSGSRRTARWWLYTVTAQETVGG